MRIETIEINNWRSICHLKADFNDFAVVIGQNNHGKSNIISSLLFFFGKIKPDKQDFLNADLPAYIEIKFSQLDENDQTTFSKYLSNDNSIKVRKTLNTDLKFSYNGYYELPNDEWLNPANSGNYTSRDSISEIPLNDLVPSSGRITKAIVEQAQTEYITANSADLEFNYTLEEGNFLGLKTVAQGIFGDVFFIPAVKSANEELKPNGSSVFSDLYAKVLNKLAESNQTYLNAKRQVNELVSILNKKNQEGESNVNRPEELNTFEQNIATELGNWNTSIEVEVTPPNIDDIFKVGTQIWINDGVKTDVNRKGNGLQRALIFALIKSYANIIRQENNQPNEGGANRQASNSSYFIIEEPELYLHPQAQRDLYSTLKTLSENNNQVIVTTHSNSFVDITEYKSLIIAKKESVAEGTTVKQCTSDLFAEIDERRKLNLIYWINPERSELFFAKKVILVEGQTDKTIIPFLAKSLSIFRNDYTLIDCGSKDNMPLYLKLLNGFKVNYIVVYDRDHQAHKSADAIASADTSSAKIEEVINSDYGKSIVFENDIEEEIGLVDRSVKNKPYIALNTVSEVDYSMPESLRNKIEQIFE
ncbi:AAA family ATPase [Fulvivirga maritima]|uniref:AAA family ATPase n=1 Tax=Fulvivirga maritima TaxID=2904247 RepID=UPI001F438296|nr:AAA family ATPase [Fulvivirga maritima]UII29120.1 AAA family ATPase [Fulvivirga maritima]